MANERRVTQEVVEVDVTENPEWRVTQEVVEVDVQENPIWRVTQMLIEVDIELTTTRKPSAIGVDITTFR